MQINLPMPSHAEPVYNKARVMESTLSDGEGKRKLAGVRNLEYLWHRTILSTVQCHLAEYSHCVDISSALVARCAATYAIADFECQTVTEQEWHDEC